MSLSTAEAAPLLGISTRMPKDRVSWITAWPMSRIFTPPWASTPVMAAVRPGRSSPVILIRTISRKAHSPRQYELQATWQTLNKPHKRRTFYPISRPYHHARRFARRGVAAILRANSSRQEPSPVNRPAPVKPDNFFLLLFKHAMQQQAEALGTSLITQTATSATELLVSNDILSLNVLLNNLVKNPLVAHAAIYSVDNRILAEAGSRPSQSMLGETEGLYSTPITFQEVIAGQLRISLDMQQFQQPMTISLQSMGILSLILLALSLSLSMRLGRHISTPLLQLRVWLRDPDDPAPGAGRQDEIGDLARQLQARLVPEKPALPEEDEEPFYDDEPVAQDDDDYLPESFDDEPDFEVRDLRDERSEEHDELTEPLHRDDQPYADSAVDDPFSELRDQPEHEAAPAPAIRQPLPSAVLAIQLGAQEQLRRLPRTRLMELLQRYRDCLDQAASLYQ